MIEKVIYLGYVELSDKLKEDFFFSEVKSNKIKVEYWDLSMIYFKKNHCIQSSDLDLVCIDNFNEFKFYLNNLNLNNVLFVSTISYNFRTIYLYFLLLKYDCKLAFFARGSLPSIKYSKKYIIKKLFNFKSYPFYFSQILKNKIAFIIKKLDLVKVYDVIYFAGKKSLKGFVLDMN